MMGMVASMSILTHASPPVQVEGMSAKTLSTSLGIGTSGSLLERSWQMEVYRSLTSLLVRGLHITCCARA